MEGPPSAAVHLCARVAWLFQPSGRLLVRNLSHAICLPCCVPPRLEHNETRRFLELMVSPVNNLVALQTVVAGALTDMQLDNYEGLRPGEHLGTPCPPLPVPPT